LDTSPPDPQLSALYQELILDHYRRPRNKGTLEQATHAVSLNNPLCGDEIDLQLRVDGDIIKEVRFIGRGCSISQAAASMMTQLVKDKSIPQALALADRMRGTRAPRGTKPWASCAPWPVCRGFPSASSAPCSPGTR